MLYPQSLSGSVAQMSWLIIERHSLLGNRHSQGLVSTQRETSHVTASSANEMPLNSSQHGLKVPQLLAG